MQNYNTIIGAIQMRLNQCPTRSVMDRYAIGSGTLALIMSRYKASGIPIEELRMMLPNEVEELFYLHTATFRGHQGRVFRPDRAILSGQS